MSWQINVFGVRHLSPMGAWQLRDYLDQIRPDIVLIEGLNDATGLIPDMTRKATRPPIAILAYTDSLPVRTLVYPLATYSPEYQAIKWAKDNDVDVEFIDLSSEHFLALQDLELELIERARQEAAERVKGPSLEPVEVPEPLSAEPEPRRSLYERCAELAGESDYETYWERHFEHNASRGSYRLASYEFGQALRELERGLGYAGGPRIWSAKRSCGGGLKRRSRLARSLKRLSLSSVHFMQLPVLKGEYPAMTDDELASLRQRSSKLTLMPYSYYKLSSQSGYGAGNRGLRPILNFSGKASIRVPFQIWRLKYMSLVARHLREAGTHRSTAEVIDGVRLARTLSALKDGLAPTAGGSPRCGDDAARSGRTGHRQRCVGPSRRRDRHRRAAQRCQPDVDSTRLRTGTGSPAARKI